MIPRVDEVKSYWNANPCNTDYSQQKDRRTYFNEISHRRYNHREWYVPIVARFEKYRNKDVLEIGCGIATDGYEFAKSGARYTGVDLTPNSIEISKERFRLFNAKGTFKVVNAEERLPFPDNSFDHIYSYGVIHHTPNPQKVVDEMYRVLRPDGTFTVMLYNKSSINYYVEIMFLRKLFRWILYPGFMPSVLSRLTGFSQSKLNGHRDVLLNKPRMTKEEWVTINTDGPHCPLSRVYDKKQAEELFSKFAQLKMEIWEFNTDHWSFVGKLIPTILARRIGRLWGWHRIIYGRKAGDGTGAYHS